MKNEKSNMSGSKLTGQEISAYFKKNPKAKAVKKAVEFALDHGGAMSYAIKGIEKMKRGLSKHPEVKKALDHANFESTQRESLQTFHRIVTENYTKNFDLLCQSLKFNKIQQKILDDFIHKGRIRDQYVGRIAGTKKEKRIFAGKKKFTGSIENRNTALMQALKVNAKQKEILDSYLKTGKVVGKYTGSIAGSTKTTKSYAGFRGFKESYDLLEGNITKSKYYKDRDRKGHEGRLYAVGVRWTDIEKAIIASKRNGKAHMSSFDGSSSMPKEVEVMGDMKALVSIADKIGRKGKVSVNKNPWKESVEVDEVKRYVKGGFTFKVEGKPKKGDLSPDTLLKGKNGKMWPSVKLVFVKSKDHWKATGSEKDLERMAWAIDQSKHMKRTSGRDDEGNLIKASVHEAKAMNFRALVSKYKRLAQQYVKKGEVPDPYLPKGKEQQFAQDMVDYLTSNAAGSDQVKTDDADELDDAMDKLLDQIAKGRQ